jgi:5-methylcytosine-specific restriction protein B
MIIAFAKKDDDAVREMFAQLYDESADLGERIKHFIASAETIRAKYAEEVRDKHKDHSWTNHYQNTNSVSTYLWLRYPEKYYIYKFELFRKTAEELDDSYRPKSNGAVKNVIDGYRMYDEICAELQKDNKLRELLDQSISDSCYSDPMMKTLTIDFGFYIARFYKTNNEEWFPSLEEYTPGFSVEDWKKLLENSSIFNQKSMNVIQDFYHNGGQATCSELAEKHGNNPMHYSGIASKLAERIHRATNCPLWEENRLWSVLFVGKNAEKADPGVFIWKLRDELYQALEKYNAETDASELDGNPRYWIYAPGANAFLWDELFDDGLMALGWEEIDDIRNYHSREEIKSKLQEYNHTQKSYHADTLALWNYAYVMKPGDIVFCKKGLHYIVGCGVVTSDYDYDPTRAMYKHIRKVKWTHKGEWEHPGQAVMKTLTDVTEYPDYVQKLKELIGFSDNPVVIHNPYTKETFLNEVYMTSTDYDTLTELLRNKQNIILQGAPGVGKTFTAKRLAYAMMGEKDDSRIEFIQFHQSYSYEDFIMGYRPDEDGGFTLTNGVFYEFCNTARNDPDRDYFFIIDEINRGNLSKIFGELLMLIEKDYRTETARLAYKNEHFSVPKNLYLIGMMNTADRSLAMIDYALRRRFSFFDMMPGFKSDGFAAYRDSLQNDTFNALIAEIIQLNHTISQDSSLGDGFCIGHSYFCNLTAETCTDARLRSIVKYDILPLLREYWFDDRDAQQTWADRLCGVFHDE